jgi:hypothetical protein
MAADFDGEPREVAGLAPRQLRPTKSKPVAMKSKPDAMKSKPDATKSKPDATKSKFPSAWIHSHESLLFNVLQQTPHENNRLILPLAAGHPARRGFELAPRVNP